MWASCFKFQPHRWKYWPIFLCGPVWLWHPHLLWCYSTWQHLVIRLGGMYVCIYWAHSLRVILKGVLCQVKNRTTGGNGWGKGMLQLKHYKFRYGLMITNLDNCLPFEQTNVLIIHRNEMEVLMIFFLTSMHMAIWAKQNYLQQDILSNVRSLL